MTSFIPNLRDVGQTINLIVGNEILRENFLFRGGTINELFGVHELPPVRSIINLRKGMDKKFKGIHNIQIIALEGMGDIESYLYDQNIIHFLEKQLKV